MPVIDESSILYSPTKADFLNRCEDWHNRLLLGQPSFSGEAYAEAFYYCGQAKKGPVFIKTADFTCKVGTGDDGYSLNQKVIEWIPVADPKRSVSCDGFIYTDLSVPPDI